MKKLIPVFALTLSGCVALQQKSRVSEDEARDRAQLEQVIAAREAGRPGEANALIKELQRGRPGSKYVLAARIEEGRLREDDGAFEEADKIYREVREQSFASEPELALMAEWRLSFTAEALGDAVRALSHVLSVEKNIRDAKPVSLYAEVPARKGILFYRLGEYRQAEAAAAEAKKNLNVLLAQPEYASDKNTLAHIYLDMGRSQAPGALGDRYLDALQAQRQSQMYLLRALRYKIEPVALDAVKLIRANYDYLYANLDKIKDEDASLDDYSRAKARTAVRIDRMNGLLAVANEALALRPLDGASKQENEIYDYVADMTDRLQKSVYAGRENNELTKESQKMNSLRRDLQRGP